MLASKSFSVEWQCSLNVDSCTLRSGRSYLFLKGKRNFEDCLPNRLVLGPQDELTVCEAHSYPWWQLWVFSLPSDDLASVQIPVYFLLVLIITHVSSVIVTASTIHSAFKWQKVKVPQIEASVLFCGILLTKIIRLPAKTNRSASSPVLGNFFLKWKRKTK